ncbi:MAG: beta-glucosidase BglX [Saprospiraceae bacterium]|nr:beta-glucosidase BglX [Saprospiraceae bacterium]MCF8252459.1 beta-glucosidase BglX [Saprospiraceae bacterium]MCF8282326.1 beta-glucosidase BglX [Bacteroidales bacterium]MCF8314054.1 beta-glucosidase BglX [Saprospiraceae bacterium]MCF8442792.1 beta-glucosidase BglX [Saprospiraceae bacterium]
MKRLHFHILATLIVMVLSYQVNAQTDYSYKNKSLPIETRVQDLLGRMTLEEKAGQLNQLNGGVLTGPQAANDPGQQGKLKLLRDGKIGSFLNVVGAAETKAVQKIAIEESRLGIPLLFAYDVIHGFKTVFPIPLAEACSWEPAMAEKASGIAANEAAAAGLHWTFAPMMDLTRDPRWGRVMEGSGEDPLINSVFAAARVRGFQGNFDNHHVMACVKHFAAYGQPEGGKEYNTVDMSRYSFWNTYSPSYHAAVDAGAATVMNSFNVFDGIPATANKFLNTDVLRNRWGFKGFLVSDWASYGELITHGVAADAAEAALKGILAGSQMDMESSAVVNNLPQLIKDGKVPQSLLDDAVSKILYWKFKLGLFDDPYKYSDEKREAATMLTPASLETARDAARKSMVLLKNDKNTLPLSKNTKNVLVAGFFADSQEDALDFWCGKGEAKDVVTYRNGIANKLPKATINYAQGYEASGKTNGKLLVDLKKKARGADVIVAVIGITGKHAGEARSLADITPPEGQMEMLRALKASGKPFVVVVHAARPMVLTEVEKLAPAILNAWIGGTAMGNGAADVLFGDYNPSAKTVISFPVSVGQIPVYYNAYSTGRPHEDGHDGPNDFWVSRYRDIPNSPLYPFGYGMSYTSFEYGDLKLSAAEMTASQTVTATVSVKNTGSREGEEIVQLYLRDLVGTYSRPVKELKGFEKINLKPSESKTVTFTIDSKMLSYFDFDGNTLLEPGKFQVFVGGNSRDVKTADLRLK